MTYEEAFINGMVCVNVHSEEQSKYIIDLAIKHKIEKQHTEFNLYTYNYYPYYAIDKVQNTKQLNAYTHEYVVENELYNIDFYIFKLELKNKFIVTGDKNIELINIQRKHKGKFLSYYDLNYLNMDQELKTYEMVSSNSNLKMDTVGDTNSDSIIMLIFNEDMSKMLISKEFRMGVNNYVYGTPAGMIDDGETVEEAAKRELKEETGLDLIEVTKILNNTYTCAPVTNMVTTVVIGKAIGDIRKDFDNPNEEIYSEMYTKEEVRELLENKEIMFAGRAQAFAYCWAYGLG